MLKPALALLIGLQVGCGAFPKSHRHKDSSSVDDQLTLRTNLYCEAAGALVDAYGFVGECGDQLLFNSLRSLGCPASPINIYSAEDAAEPGKWHRDAAQSCYKEGRTDSELSRDMTLGLGLWFWSQGEKALPAVERFIAYAEAHDWVICNAKTKAIQFEKCDVKQNLQATWYELRYRLGGADSDKRNGLQFEDPTAKDFEAHLSILHLLWRGLMFGAVNSVELGILEAQAEREPNNAFFAAVAKKFKTSDLDAQVHQVLNDAARFPDDHLPDSAGRCTNYLWQRDFESADNWTPCKAKPDGTPADYQVYNGIDLAIFRAVANDYLPVTHAGAALDEGMHPYHWREPGERSPALPPQPILVDSDGRIL